MRNVPLLDLVALHAPIREKIDAEIRHVVDAQRFIMGEKVEALEQAIANYCSSRFAVGCASGTDALYLALLAAEIGPGDHVLTTPFTFFATAGAIHRAGATPVFADIEPRSFNLDVNLAAEALRKDPKIRAIMPVHLFGACADMDPVLEMARERDCIVIEDGAQSIGSEYKEGRAQSIGAMGCISFFPSKNLGAFGDGGMVTTNDEALAQKLASLRVHGSQRKYYHEMVGINSRLDALQAAILLVKLPYLDSWTAGRQKNAALYRQCLGPDSPVGLPETWDYQTRHIYNQFVIRSERRDELKTWLQQRGVGTEIYYPLPLHLQPCFAHLGLRVGAFPESEKAAGEVLALPIHSALQEDEIVYVCDSIREFRGGS